MSWNYRIVRYKGNQGYGLHEVYYDKKEKPINRTERPCGFCVGEDETPEELIEDIERALKDAKTRPILDDTFE